MHRSDHFRDINDDAAADFQILHGADVMLAAIAVITLGANELFQCHFIEVRHIKRSLQIRRIVRFPAYTLIIAEFGAINIPIWVNSRYF